MLEKVDSAAVKHSSSENFKQITDKSTSFDATNGIHRKLSGFSSGLGGRDGLLVYSFCFAKYSSTRGRLRFKLNLKIISR